jgi:outer membrane protein assembly factor BamB
VILERGRGIKAGRVVAVNAGSGRTRWSHKLPSRAESSPLVVGKTVSFGP